jgi:predicted HicB family RNase H-like nuclease
MRFSQPLPELIRVRVAHDEKRQLFELARQRGISVSEFVRDAVTEATKQVEA